MILVARWRIGGLAMIVVCLSTSCVGASPSFIERLKVWVSPEVRAINEELLEIESELNGLPVMASANSGTRRGFHTGRRMNDGETWIELTLSEPAEVDQFVLLPLLAKSAQGDQPGFGFPKRFQIESETADEEILLLRDETAEDFPNPGLYPVVTNVPSGVKISRVRFTVTKPWVRGDPDLLALSEVMLLKGNLNISGRAEVSASSSREMPPTWTKANLIDSVTPLGLPTVPDAGAHPLGWHSEIAQRRATEKSVTVDLGRSYSIEEIRLVPVWMENRQAWPLYGYPPRFIVEFGEKEDFSDLHVVRDESQYSHQPPGQSLQSYQGDQEMARYVRIRATSLKEQNGDFSFALAELQVYSGNENVAFGARVLSEESLEDDQWGRAALTDGMAGGGKLIELPEWFGSLNQRRSLEKRKATLMSERAALLVHLEQLMIGGSVGGTGVIGVLAGVLLWRGNRQRKIDRETHRERLARDLHDEIGSNLGSIALISSFAVEKGTSEEQMRSDLVEIEEVARESADSMRDMVELLGGGQTGASSDWLEVMERMARRLLRTAALDCRMPVGAMIVEPDLETRREIYLFCKEVLHNVAKHSGAENVRFHMKAESSGLLVEIADDGCGFAVDAVASGFGLKNLKGRAARLQATMRMDTSPQGNTAVSLKIPRGRRWRKPEVSKN